MASCVMPVLSVYATIVWGQANVTCLMKGVEVTHRWNKLSTKWQLPPPPPLETTACTGNGSSMAKEEELREQLRGFAPAEAMASLNGW